MTPLPIGDVRGDGDSSSTKLGRQTEPLFRRKFLRGLVDAHNQIHRLLPCDQISVMPHAHRSPPPDWALTTDHCHQPLTAFDLFSGRETGFGTTPALPFATFSAAFVSGRDRGSRTNCGLSVAGLSASFSGRDSRFCKAALSSTAPARRTRSPGRRGSFGKRPSSASLAVNCSSLGSGVCRTNAERSKRCVTCTRRIVNWWAAGSPCTKTTLCMPSSTRASVGISTTSSGGGRFTVALTYCPPRICFPGLSTYPLMTAVCWLGSII